MKHLLALCAIVVVSGCAKNPDAITPMSMPVNAYAGLSCDQLREEHHRSSAALVAAEAQQRQAVTGDAVGVFLIGVPMSSLTGGDKEGVVALHKGEIVAINSQLRGKQCSA